MTKEKKKEIIERVTKEFEDMPFVQVDQKYGTIRIPLYELVYVPDGLITLSGALNRVRMMPEYEKKYETDVDYGYYGDVDNFKIEISLK